MTGIKDLNVVIRLTWAATRHARGFQNMPLLVAFLQADRGSSN